MVAPNGNGFHISPEQLRELKRLAELHGLSLHDYLDKLIDQEANQLGEAEDEDEENEENEP